jgi:AmmeMemoRadiSam system protein B
MNLRQQYLPPGWYPQSEEKIDLFLQPWKGKQAPGLKKNALAALAPHAGWYYSGGIAAAAVSALGFGEEPGAAAGGTVVVIGGHLPAGYPPLFAEEDAASTPLGALPMDGEFRDLLRKELGGRPDRYQDNTVEVQLPMVKYFFPGAHLLWLRLPADRSSFDAGKRIAETGIFLNRKLLVLGSTDLTHYGGNYNFAPRGRGKKALEWVREVNDQGFIRGVIGADPDETLRRAEWDRSACSAGAALGCLGFAEAAGLARAELLAYGTSADARDPGSPGEVPDSFVGYAALAWYRG